MTGIKSKSLENIEEKLENIDKNSFRYHVLKSAKDFKTSWIELGRALYEVWKDKLYKEWGYAHFDAYTAKEIGIKKLTAMKLLRSYYFLEKEEPQYLKNDNQENIAAAPSLEAVELLRSAKAKKGLDESDYNQIKQEVFEKGKDVFQAKKDLTSLIRERRQIEPEEAFRQRRVSAVRRFVSTLRSLKKEIELSKLLPAPLVREAEALIKKLEDELSK